MKKLGYISLAFSIIALALSIYATLVCDKRIEADWMGILVGILALLTTVLLGWQLISALNINSMKRDMKEIKDETRLCMENNLVEFHSSMALYISAHENYLKDEHLGHRYIMNRLYAIIHLYNVGDFNRCEEHITTLLELLEQQERPLIPIRYKEALTRLISHVSGLREVSNHHRILELLNMNIFYD